jgi:hypothetical protein
LACPTYIKEVTPMLDIDINTQVVEQNLDATLDFIVGALQDHTGT